MKSVFRLLLLVLVAACAAVASAAPKGAPPVEGRDFQTIPGGQPYQPVAGRVEVAEVFGYVCSHCARFEPTLVAWSRSLPKGARLVRVPAAFGGYWTPYARAYVAAQTLGVVDRTHEAMFRALHDEQSLPMMDPSVDELAGFYARHGVTRERFAAAYASPAVEAELRKAREFITRSGVEGTPTLVVAGKYLVTGTSQASVLRTTRWLVDRELAAPRGR